MLPLFFQVFSDDPFLVDFKFLISQIRIPWVNPVLGAEFHKSRSKTVIVREEIPIFWLPPDIVNIFKSMYLNIFNNVCKALGNRTLVRGGVCKVMFVCVGVKFLLFFIGVVWRQPAFLNYSKLLLRNFQNFEFCPLFWRNKAILMG